jgi:hypothetical protein
LPTNCLRFSLLHLALSEHFGFAGTLAMRGPTRMGYYTPILFGVRLLLSLRCAHPLAARPSLCVRWTCVAGTFSPSASSRPAACTASAASTAFRCLNFRTLSVLPICVCSASLFCAYSFSGSSFFFALLLLLRLLLSARLRALSYCLWRSQARGISFEQMDREENWDDYILLQVLLRTSRALANAPVT